MWSELSHPWQVCVEQAWRAWCADSYPIGAAVVGPDGQVLSVGSGHLLPRDRIQIFGARSPARPLDEHPLAHAELQALLCLDYEQVDPHACTLYTTMEPCPLCVGAAAMADVRTLRYACRDPWAGCTRIIEQDPYVRTQITTVVGPEHRELEIVLAALAAEHIIRTCGASAVDWYDGRRRAVCPGGVRLAEMLSESGRLARMREAGTSAEQMAEELAGLIPAVD